MFTMMSFAQDIIVQKDGSTIQAKVLKVSRAEVEYKKFNNQNGPTYTISTKDLQCINYENGTKDTFVSPNYNPNIVTNETATQFSNDEQLLNLYKSNNAAHKRSKIFKTIGWAGAPVIALGIFGLSAGICTIDEVGVADSDTAIMLISLTAGLTAGTTWCALFNKKAKSIESQSKYSVFSAPIYQQEFKVGKSDRLMVGVDVLKDNTRSNHTLGFGVSYNF